MEVNMVIWNDSTRPVDQHHRLRLTTTTVIIFCDID